MLAGHYASAFVLKRFAPDVPLWALCLGVQAVDVGYMLLVLANVESATVDNSRDPRFIVSHGIWTHSLLMTLVYGVACVVIGWMVGRRRWGWIAAAAVTSHWIADVVVHVPDLPMGLTDAPAVGLGLWKWPVASALLECALVVATAQRRYWMLAASLVALQLANDFVLPMDTDLHVLAVKALALYGGVAIAAWYAEKGRTAGLRV